MEGAAQFASAPELTEAKPLRELLAAIEEKSRLVALLNGCIEAPEPVHVQIGVKEINGAGEHLSLITAPYLVRDQGQGSLGVLGPMRMQYERAITAVAYMARAFSDAISRERRSPSEAMSESDGASQERGPDKRDRIRSTLPSCFGIGRACLRRAKRRRSGDARRWPSEWRACRPRRTN